MITDNQISTQTENPLHDWFVSKVTTGNTLADQAIADNVDLDFDAGREFRNKDNSKLGYITVSHTAWGYDDEEGFSVEAGVATNVGGNIIPVDANVAKLRNWFRVTLWSGSRDNLWKLQSWLVTYCREAFGAGLFKITPGKQEIEEVLLTSAGVRTEIEVSFTSELPRFTQRTGSTQINATTMVSFNVLKASVT